MDINVYLPDQLGQKAKAEGLNFSGVLRAAVIDELRRREEMKTLLEDVNTFELSLENGDGVLYVGRLTGVRLHAGDDFSIYLTDDERVLVHEEDKLKYHELDDPEEQLRGWLDDANYFNVATELGLKPTIDI